MLAVKVTITTPSGTSGTKFVTRNSGTVHTVKTRKEARALIARCQRSAITGIKETYEIVTA